MPERSSAEIDMTGRRRRALTSHLEWMLDGLETGRHGWGREAAERMSPGYAARLAPEQFGRIAEDLARQYAPLTVKSVLITGRSVKAALSTQAGEMALTITVEDDGRLLMSSCNIVPLTGSELAPRLPERFDADDFPSAPASGARLAVFAGLPGTGKSTLADRLGQETGTPVFAADWLLGALTPFGGRLWDNLLDMAAEQLTHLAYRQLLVGQSAILDHPCEDVALRERWTSLAHAVGATFSVVECQCEDVALHQSRLSTRTRGIPGWHDAGSWDVVARRRAAYVPWTGAHVLSVDASAAIDDNMMAIREFVR